MFSSYTNKYITNNESWKKTLLSVTLAFKVYPKNKRSSLIKQQTQVQWIESCFYWQSLRTCPEEGAKQTIKIRFINSVSSNATHIWLICLHWCLLHKHASISSLERVLVGGSGMSLCNQTWLTNQIDCVQFFSTTNKQSFFCLLM